jgi:hypothetical protein
LVHFSLQPTIIFFRLLTCVRSMKRKLSKKLLPKYGWVAISSTFVLLFQPCKILNAEMFLCLWTKIVQGSGTYI